jgi:putative endonuclease
MSRQQEHGKWGEDLAVDFLQKQGYVVLERNWRYKRAEVDVICRDGSILVFVEVKMRAYDAFGKPEEKVVARKQRLMIDAAMAYMRAIEHEWEIRFDIVAITGSPGLTTAIRHYPDAFFPGLDNQQ